MTRKIVRTGLLLCVVVGLVCILGLLSDRVLPPSIHNHLPLHHTGLVITDIKAETCSRINPFSRCKLDPEKWHRVEKDLYLDSGWVSQGYIHIKRKREEELTAEDKVVMGVRIGRLDPAVGEKDQAREKWESRPGGIWLKRSARRRDSDSDQVVTAVDVLFGADAVEPRPGWELKDTPLLLDNPVEGREPRLSIRKGQPHNFEKPVPRIRKDGRFKILQVADLHLSTGTGVCRDPVPPGYNGGKCEADPRTFDFVGKILDDEKPDLVVLTGDQINGETSPDTQSGIYKFAELFIHRKVPFATIFGNHDAEGSLSRSAMMSLLESLPYSLSEAGPSNIDGVGNYVVEVLGQGSSHHSALTLYMLDTHAYSPDERQFPGYDWIKPSQIQWFKDTAQERKKAHEKYTHIHMDMAFIHIPLPEYADAKNYRVGAWKEGVTAPAFNSGFKKALVEEGIVAVACGHDHVNEYCSLSKTANDKPELWMCYGGGSGFGGYGGYGDYVRRLRLFEIDTNDARITTWKRLEHGETDKRIDEQTLVEGGKVVAG